MTKNTNRLAALIFAGALLAGCGSSASDAADTTVADTSETEATTAGDTPAEETEVTEETMAATEATAAETETETETETEVDTETEQASVFALGLGECIVSSVTGEVSDVELIDCEAPHEWEAYHVFDVAAAEFDQAAVDNEADTGCLAAFEPFVGLDYDSSIYGFTSLTPTAGSWGEGDREIICLVGNYDGTDKTGTAGGTGL